MQEERYGYGAGPCRLAEGIRQKDLEIISHVLRETKCRPEADRSSEFDRQPPIGRAAFEPAGSITPTGFTS